MDPVARTLLARKCIKQDPTSKNRTGVVIIIVNIMVITLYIMVIIIIVAVIVIIITVTLTKVAILRAHFVAACVNESTWL